MNAIDIADQGSGQTALLALAFYGVVALAVRVLFRGIRSVASPRVGASS